MSVKSRLLLMATVSVAALVLLLAIAIFSMYRLAGLQDAGYAKTHAQSAAAEASKLGSQLYQVIADTIINRNLDAARKDFAAVSQESFADLDALDKMADTQAEHDAVAQARKAVVLLVELYEKKLLPMLNEKNEVASELKALDGEIDQNVKGIRE